MNDGSLAPSLARWLRENQIRPPDPAEGTRQVMARVAPSRQVGRWWPPAPRYVAAGMGRGFTARRLAAATTLVGVLGVIAVVGAGSALSDVRRSFVAGSSGQEDGRAVHWRSAVADLQADALTLTVEEETYTTEGVEVIVDSYDGDLGQWALYPRWVEDGETFWLYLEFDSDGESWTLRPWLWREGVIGPGDVGYDNYTIGSVEYTIGSVEYTIGSVEPDYHPSNANVEFPDAFIRMPLGQPYVGDWRLEDRISVPTCDPSTPELVDVSLIFENLRLSVSPRAPTFLDELSYAWFHRGSMLGDIFKGSLEPPRPRILECPEGSGAP